MSIRDVPVIGRALLVLLAAAAFVSNSAFAQLVEGKNYARITNPHRSRRTQDRGHRILLVRLPALRGARATSTRGSRSCRPMCRFVACR
jgi:hypothetical protein